VSAKGGKCTDYLYTREVLDEQLLSFDLYRHVSSGSLPSSIGLVSPSGGRREAERQGGGPGNSGIFCCRLEVEEL